jgi:hypothetical protein
MPFFAFAPKNLVQREFGHVNATVGQHCQQIEFGDRIFRHHANNSRYRSFLQNFGTVIAYKLDTQRREISGGGGVKK